jgi:hypothetical protein
MMHSEGNAVHDHDVLAEVTVLVVNSSYEMMGYRMSLDDGS